MWFPLVRLLITLLLAASPSVAKKCEISPLGEGLDDTEQVETAIEECGRHGWTVLNPGLYNITRKMTWDLHSSKVDLYGYLNFQPDIEYWLDAENTYRVVFIQSQASWFVVTGSDFTIDAHNEGGIQGNGQPWWEYFTTHTRADGDGRPLSLTLYRATNSLVKDFHIQSPPFWCNAVAESSGIRYEGMVCNATNSNPQFAGQNIVPNTDGIDTYRSDNITLLNWDVTCGDDCLAIKGNSTNVLARNITCRGGNGIAFGSLGQYYNLSDQVDNVHLEDLQMIRIDANVQPNMETGVYFKTWTGTVNGSPPTGGGGGKGFVSNIVAKNVLLDRVTLPLHLYQTNGGHSGDLPSLITFANLQFLNWSGTAMTNEIVDIECSTSCDEKSKEEERNFQVAVPLEGKDGERVATSKIAVASRERGYLFPFEMDSSGSEGEQAISGKRT
ncbi:pectin lyase-like protein [Guyanagaster necrorhizus]|uniref:galacturonan 1,4-alpha-galacturonidase n=1 Tax=Guyanagaster necrorhizus TaxID=856835 RepID=A0A9P7W2S3_9AGAR|nr:pectin lyase-like protein [Guyanagaster necrorhizus MCA 3950]KAG7451524.1 pectin lyase-like protein [Guyanagaster necrorhizus MCA 3950]